MAPSLWQRCTERLEKPRAVGCFSTRLFTSAAKPWLSLEPDPNEEVETSSWTFQPPGVSTGQDTPALQFILLVREQILSP